MIPGRFLPRNPGGAPAPHLLAGVRLLPSGRAEAIDSLVDTGADSTTVHPADALLLWPGYLTHDFVNDTTLRHFGGIGGSASFVQRRVEIIFIDDPAGTPAPVVSQLDVWVAPPYEEALWGFPSLLGRDVLSQFALTVDGPGNVVGLTLPA